MIGTVAGVAMLGLAVSLAASSGAAGVVADQAWVPAARFVRGGVEAGVPAARFVRGGVEAGAPAARLVRGGVEPLTLRVATRARSLRPGEVVLVTVTASRALTGLDGSAFGAAVMSWTETDRVWRALIGIPIDTAAGTYRIELTGTTADGSRATRRVTLVVPRARFRTRRLSLDDRFVNPPTTVEARIASEGQAMAAVYAKAVEERLWRGSFARPVPGAATSSFGRLSVLNNEPRGRHLGTDLQAREGVPVSAPNSGIVALTADQYFAGNTVVLDHGGGLFSLFAHLSEIAVQVGARVERGDPIGAAGATGRVTGPHLHWATRLHGVSVDPLSLSYAVALLR